MAYAKAVVTIPNALLGSPGPLSSNTLHFHVVGAADVNETAANAIIDAVETCWETLGPIYGQGADTSPLVSVYDVTEAGPHNPVAIREITIDPGDSCLPTEAAINVHFRAARVSGVPAQRARATLQLGPLAVSTLDDDLGTIAGATLTLVSGAFSALADDVNVLYPWVVGSLAHGWHEVTVAYVNNEFGSVSSRQGLVTASAGITLP